MAISFLKKLILPLYTSIEKAFAVLRQFFNWYVPNVIAFSGERIVLTVNHPQCDQLTRITGAGKVVIGRDCCFGFKLGGFFRCGMIELQARYKGALIKLGNNIYTNNNVFLCAANYIEIGDDSLIGHFVSIIDHDAHGVHPNARRRIGVVGRVVLGKNVWVGNNVTILKNSVIGDNTIVAAGAVVVGEFPPNVLIGGVPARVIKKFEVG